MRSRQDGAAMKVFVVFRSEENGITLNLTSGFALFPFSRNRRVLGTKDFHHNQSPLAAVVVVVA